jgi:hypothetical protein
VGVRAASAGQAGDAEGGGDDAGDAKLTLGRGPVTLTGPHAAEFTVVAQPRETLEVTAGSRFVIRFAPKAAAVRKRP